MSDQIANRAPAPDSLEAVRERVRRLLAQDAAGLAEAQAETDDAKAELMSDQGELDELIARQRDRIAATRERWEAANARLGNAKQARTRLLVEYTPREAQLAEGKAGAAVRALELQADTARIDLLRHDREMANLRQRGADAPAIEMHAKTRPALEARAGELAAALAKAKAAHAEAARTLDAFFQKAVAL